MCGFIGFTGMRNDRREILDRMASRMIHRGPDSGGSFFGEDISLGFRRLSIIDLSDMASQPMYNEDNSVAIVFNGEIYNFQELRETLISLGHVFKNKCDTEVIVHGYEEYGYDIVHKLRGMFAFVLWDAKKKILFGARDFFGIKPFYYSKLKSGEMIFGSEIKTFLEHPDFVREVNEQALKPYLTFQYSSMEETFFKGVYKLPPAHYFVYDGKTTEITRYWDIDFSKKSAESFEECADTIDKTVRESVQAHRISDVKVGAFLSGGVDSSYITATLMPDKTFSVGFAQEKFDETTEAEALSKILGIRNYKKIITPDECFEKFPEIQYHMDEPQSNPSSVPLYFLAQLASEHVTVVLSGEGADEIYAGYEWYDDTAAMKKYKKIPAFIRRAAASVASALPYFKGRDMIIKSSGRPEDYFIGQALVFPEKDALDVLNDKYKNAPSVREITAPFYERAKNFTELEKKQYLDLNLWLAGDILLKADKMSMAHSLELRVPFLDKVVMAGAQEIKSEYKINGVNTKYVMRHAANKTLPDEWANRTKLGFPVPIREWLREEKYYNIVKSYFTSDYAAEFFDTDKLMSLLDDHRAQKANNGRKIWTTFTFLTWYKKFFIDFPA
jgi:asparagine synthase (glutamine-hydrolyzing)